MEDNTPIDSFKGKYHFLSNFYVETNNGTSTEHRYQAMKATNDRDANWVMLASTPGEAKKRGRNIQMSEHFEGMKDEIMLRLVRIKFSQPYLAEKLLATGDRELIEGNWWGDTYWGVCKGVGENRLGKILMRVRDELRGH